MSLVEQFEGGPKSEISRSVFWQQVEVEYCGGGESHASRMRWRRLAMTHLYIACNWTCERIASAFGCDRCNVSRQIRVCQRHLRDKFEFAPESENIDPRHPRESDQHGEETSAAG